PPRFPTRYRRVCTSFHAARAWRLLRIWLVQAFERCFFPSPSWESAESSSARRTRHRRCRGAFRTLATLIQDRLQTAERRASPAGEQTKPRPCAAPEVTGKETGAAELPRPSASDGGRAVFPEKRWTAPSAPWPCRFAVGPPSTRRNSGIEAGDSSPGLWRLSARAPLATRDSRAGPMEGGG